MELRGEMQMFSEISDCLDLFPLLFPPLSPPPSEPDLSLLSPTFSVGPRALGLASLRYKTELCSRYAESGSCAYRQRCQFAHGLSELRPPRQHPKYKTELCRSFHVLGTCNYGVRCLFIHSPQERRSPPSPPAAFLPRHPASHRRERCRLLRSPGGCPYGPRCHFQHPQGVREACRHFAALGECPYGAHCHFAHRPPADRWGLGTRGSGSLSPTELDSDPGTPLFSESPANNAFTFCNLLLPLALRLQSLGGEGDFSGIGDPLLLKGKD
ncbi:hypothetical protein FKM82_029301 [Ascaphus truei]